MHDIGHLIGQKHNLEQMDGLGALFHETIGYEILKKLNMNETVCFLVKNHVQAKRYLVTKYEDYFDTLSEASKRTLEYQGGKMSDSELSEFENYPLFETIKKIWDILSRSIYIFTQSPVICS